ncbi:MAG: NAD(P)-dependent oxidoreductase [Cereibacter sp.]
MRGSILITPRSLSKGGHPALSVLQDRGYDLVMPAPGMIPDERALLGAVPDCLGWLAGVEPVSEAVIDAARRLRVISRNGTGVDNLPLQVLKARQIRVFRAEGANAQGVAELALALSLAGLRRIVWTHEGMRRGDWPRSLGREIAGARIAVVGLGAVGTAYARMCLDLGARVAGHDPHAPEGLFPDRGFVRTTLDAALAGADVVSLHAPMPADGRPLLTAARISALAQGAVVVNTARAGLVDATAVRAALGSGRIACYATDVFETEPPASSPLLDHPGVVMTSHIGGFTDASVERSTIRAVENLLLVLDGDAD